MKLISIIKVIKLCLTNKNFVVNRGLIASANEGKEVISYTFGSDAYKDGRVTITSN